VPDSVTPSASPRLVEKTPATAVDHMVVLMASVMIPNASHNATHWTIDPLAKEKPDIAAEVRISPGMANFRDPHRSIKEPAKGDPQTVMMAPNVMPMVISVLLQPNSAWSESKNNPNPGDMKEKKETPTEAATTSSQLAFHSCFAVSGRGLNAPDPDHNAPSAALLLFYLECYAHFLRFVRPSSLVESLGNLIDRKLMGDK
jgi:hypothetical protein